MDPFKDFDRSREEIRELADQGREEAGEREPIPDEELDDEARAVRERLRAERREKKRRAARAIKTFYIVVLVALIAAMLWAFVGIGSRNGEASAAEAEQTIQRFARAWYSDWEFEDGEQVAVGGDEVEDFLVVGSDAQQAWASREVDADSVFAQKGDTCFETCLVARDGGSYTLQVSYYEADGPVDEAAWDEMRDEGPEEASYVVEVDHTGQITDVEAAD